MKLTERERVDEVNEAEMAGNEEMRVEKRSVKGNRGRGRDGGCRVSHGTRQSGGEDGEMRLEKE